jgi:hypothetical protein
MEGDECELRCVLFVKVEVLARFCRFRISCGNLQQKNLVFNGINK